MTLWRDIFDSLFEALLLISPKLELKAVNPAAQTMLGISRPTRKALATLIARNLWLRHMVEKCIAGGHDFRDAEAKLRLPDRSTLEVSVRVSPIFDRKGEIRGALVQLSDRSHGREIERALDTSANKPALSVVGLAHEVKNPLTGIKGAAELLMAMFPNEPRVRQYGEVILGGVSRLTHLVEQVMNLGGLEPIRPVQINIHKVLHQALAMAGLWPTAPEGITLELFFDPSLPSVEGDPAALERVFLNLLMNAREAIGNRGTIRLSTRMETEFHLADGGRRRRFMRIDVTDSGKGISREQMAELFTPFFTTKPAGTGLGLVLSKHIVTRHGGRLWAELGASPTPALSGADVEPYRAQNRLSGLTFKILLPVVEQEVSDSSDEERGVTAQAGVIAPRPRSSS